MDMEQQKVHGNKNFKSKEDSQEYEGEAKRKNQNTAKEVDNSKEEEEGGNESVISEIKKAKSTKNKDFGNTSD